MIDHLEKSLKSDGVKALSADIFDTLLFRNFKPEVYRFFEIADYQEHFFNDAGHNLTRDDLFHARLLCTPIAYKSAKMVNFERDAGIAEIFKLLLKIFNLECEEYVRKLIEIEVNYELENLKLNHNLVDLLVRNKGTNLKFYFLSDMYLNSQHIAYLINALAPKITYSKIYVSSEWSLTKSAGGLFDLFCQKEGFEPEQVIHIGDNYQSDYLSAVKKGFQAVYWPRSRFFKNVRNFREFIFRLRYRKLLP